MAATAIIVGAPAAGAHPRLLSADPKPSTVAPGPVDRITVHFDEAVQWQYSQIDVEDTKGHSVRASAPTVTGREAIIPLVAGASGPLRVNWRLVGVDAHPVIGAYVFGIQGAAVGGDGSADLDTAIRQMAGTLGEGRIGSEGLNWAIRGGRSLEIILLYVVLGILMLRVFVLKEAAVTVPLTSRGTPPDPGPDGGYRMMRTLGIAAAIAMPILFALYVARLDSAVGNVAFGKVLFSSLGETWAIKTVLWIGIAAACFYGLRPRGPGGVPL
ncbi:MAG TPA: copper resistance CopC family protein, partial [Acidimicrobiia bacterium]|nr:copper resistance CopC family protein [Acidimicrobiia bacterium]